MGGGIMIEFAWKEAFLLLPLPYLIYKFFPECLNEKAMLRVPEVEDFQCFKQNKMNFSAFKMILLSVIFGLLVLSAARPVVVEEISELPVSGRDLMLAVDLSASMQIRDFEIKGRLTDRLTALKHIAADFIDKRKGDRIGLILFGSESYLQAPLTFDIITVKQLLMEAEVGLAGNETAIGDAIGLAVKQLRDSPQSSRVLILLTDGNNNTGSLNPEKAAEIAAHAGLKIHTVAIGSKQKNNNSFQYMQGADIDEKALKSIADKTGGNYFRAYNSKELQSIYSQIDKLESVESLGQSYRSTVELYHWPLLIALAFSGLLLFYKSFSG
jgi:Ca-activated chloride channel family protein